MKTKKKKTFNEVVHSRTFHDNLTGYLLIMPNLVGFTVFTLFGIIFSLTMAFTDWNIIKGYEVANWVGIKNFTDMVGDTYLKACIRNNLLLLLVIPVTLFLAMIIASVLNNLVYGKAGARALYFLPYVTNIVAVATVWRALFHNTQGPINMFIKAFGVAEENLPGWLSSSDWALPAVMIVLLWMNIGYDILMYSGAIANIPKELYEAAEMDGANTAQQFFNITIPQIKPTTFLLMILGIIGSLQMWSFVQIITKGGPGTATYTIGLYIYKCSFLTHRDGYACALSWFLTAIIMVVTAIRWKTESTFDAE